MHFREQGRSLQLIRTTYQADKGRGSQQVVARIPLHTYELPADVEALLTAEELAQTRDYLATIKTVRSEREHMLTLAYGHTSIERILAALQAGVRPTETDAAKLRDAMKRLDRALTKTGFPRKPKPESSTPAA